MFRNFIAQQFKRPSGLFGNFSSKIMIKGNRKNYEILIKEMDIQSDDKLLEIGYGPGLGIQMVSKLCQSCTIYGIDFSKLMYNKARKFNKSNISRGRVQLQCGDFLKTPIAENQYDKIFCLNVIYFWDELNIPFEKTLSLLKTSGIFYLFMANANTLNEIKAPDSVFNKYTIEQVVEGLKSAGFIGIEHNFNKGYYIRAIKSAGRAKDLNSLENL